MMFCEVEVILDTFPAVIVTHKESGIMVRESSSHSAMRNVQIAMGDIAGLLERMKQSTIPIGQDEPIKAASGGRTKRKPNRKGK